MSGRTRFFWARPAKHVPLQFSGFYPATLPDEWNKEKERDNNDKVYRSNRGSREREEARDR